MEDSVYSNLLRMIKAEVFAYVYILCIAAMALYILIKLIKKIEKPLFSWGVSGAVLTLAIAYSYRESLMGTTFVLQIVFAAIITGAIFALGLLELPGYDYLFLLAVMVLVKAVGAGGQLSLLAVYLFCILAVLIGLEGKRVRSQIFTIWMSMIFALGIYLVYDYLNTYYVQRTVNSIGREYGLNNAGKLLIWGGIIAVYAVVIIGCVRLFRKYSGQIIEDLKQMDRRYVKLGNEFILTAFVVLFFTYVFSLIISVSVDVLNPSVNTQGLRHGFDLMMLFIQTIYMVLLMKLVRAKAVEEVYIREKQDLILYNSNLERNMNEIRGIKHDIKNIFFTMGEYVARSTDTDMRAFFQEKIAPFAKEEVLKSDIYMKLQEIDEEEFRAFLFYKVNQAISCGIEVCIDVKATGGRSAGGYAFMDLIRALGIYLDNAIEAAADVEAGGIELRIMRTDETESYTIANSVREDLRMKGVIPGTTTKGLGRGNGLLIAQEIVGKYPDMISNSYFKNGKYYQNITIYQE